MARWAISNWLNRCRRSSRSRNEWIEGWVSCAVDESWHDNPPKRPRLEEPEPYSSTTHAVGDEDIQFDSVQLWNGNTRAYFFSEGQGFATWYEVNLSHNILKERRYFESLSRKMMVPLDPNRTRPSSGGSDVKDESIKEKLCQKLGIPSCFVTDLYRKTVPASETVPDHPCPVIAADAPIDIQPNMPKSRFYFNEDQLITTLTSERPMQCAQMTRSCPDVQSCLHKGHQIMIGAQKKNPLDMTLELPEQATASQRVTLSCMNIISQPLVPKDVVADTLLDLSTLSSKFVTSHPKILMSKNQNRARKLLKAGCMLLFPPARRDWDKEEIVEFTAKPVSIRWPPRSWKKISADRKLLSVEYAAMTLEANLTSGHIPNIDRGDLIDRYNPLVLPGTSQENGQGPGQDPDPGPFPGTDFNQGHHFDDMIHLAGPVQAHILQEVISPGHHYQGHLIKEGCQDPEPDQDLFLQDALVSIFIP
ncbi:hypothetical protein CHS0354_030138 [Potamilus streckersoni]|uniref:Uncharacterized protein n=1 Tax=Potamilus streckersoni TaxID=2493646 RepID=A0AAE0ST60_9BIVA|nr:hypothetical protein CHS0354_030138 [Potamilus streckersoni]